MVTNRLIDAPCKRCGRTVATAVRSPLGLDHLKAKWGVICQSCITPEERHQMLMEQGEAIAVRVATRYPVLPEKGSSARGRLRRMAEGGSRGDLP